MKTFLIVANGLKEHTKECVKNLEAFLEEKEVAYRIMWIQYNTNLMVDMESMDFSNYEAAIVIGGDGTLIRASRALKEKKLPMIGVNVGNIGYLCEIDRDHLIESMEKVLAGDYFIEERMLLYGETKNVKDEALNEVAIYRGGSLCVIKLELYVDGKYLTTYRGDGLVIATPTGSTGYNISCGGPIVNPASHMILVTPIAPHSVSSLRSIVLEDRVDIEVRPVFRNGQEPEEILVSFDGADTVPLKSPIHIRKAGNTTRLLRLTQSSFIDIIKKKLEL